MINLLGEKEDEIKIIYTGLEKVRSFPNNYFLIKKELLTQMLKVLCPLQIKFTM